MVFAPVNFLDPMYDKMNRGLDNRNDKMVYSYLLVYTISVIKKLKEYTHKHAYEFLLVNNLPIRGRHL